MPNQSDSRKTPETSEGLRLVDRKLAHHFGWDGTERRQHPRFSVQWNGILERHLSESQTTAEVRLSDVSEGGCCIFLRNPLAGPDQRTFLIAAGPLNLVMLLPGGVVRSLVELRWYMPIEDDGYAAGLQFLSMASRDRAILLSALQGIGCA